MTNEYLENIDMLPAHMQGGMLRYIEKGIAPGGFLTAVLCNDLKGAVARADSTNVRALPAYAQYLMWHTPSACSGSPEFFDSWCAAGGLNGMRAKEGISL